MVNLTMWQKKFLQHQGEVRSMRVINTPGFRGMITDRNGAPLAASTPIYSVWLNPKEFEFTDINLRKITHALNLNYKNSYKKILTHQNKSFLYIKREVDPATAQKVKQLNLKGVHLQSEYKRFYPEGEVTSQLVGFTNIDDKGQEGMELLYNQWLTGQQGKQLVIKDLKGRVIEVLENMKTQEPGHDLALSIDKRIQFLAYQSLKEAQQKFDAKAASAVVLNIKTGEVLAMVNLPSYNPNDRSGYDSSYRNRAVTDVFEPGSTMKVFSIFSALDSGEYTPETIVETAPGWWKVGHNWVHDELNYGTLTVNQVLQKSSNVGVAKMTLSLPGDQLWGVLHKVGFGQLTDSSFPGEQSGYLIHQDKWNPFALATLAFGYGVSVNTLQLAQAYAVIGNSGKKTPVSLLKLDKPAIAEQIIDPEVAKEMLTMLEKVVAPGGTGSRALVQGYRVAGKTGTAKVAGPGGYYKHKYVGSFVGIAPASDPELVVAVVIFEPQGKAYFGGLVAAPAFSKIMGGALSVLNIAPDTVDWK